MREQAVTPNIDRAGTKENLTELNIAIIFASILSILGNLCLTNTASSKAGLFAVGGAGTSESKCRAN